MKFITALCQMGVGMDKGQNIEKAEAMIRKASSCGASVVALPEMWNCPYSNKYFREYAEDDGGETAKQLSRMARDCGVYLIGGSIPEIDRSKDKIYNTCFVFDREGKFLARHRKIHLFDINVKRGISFKESDTLSPGNEMTVFDTEYGKMGVAICYDVRFPELFREMVLSGAELIFLPGAFNMTTGPAHWELTLRTRALDNQIYLGAISPARDLEGSYQAYGHSCLVNPWGEFCAKTDSRESIVYGEVDRDYTASVREQLPLLAHRKPDVYGLER